MSQTLVDVLALPQIARPRQGGDPVGILRAVGRRLVVFPLRLCAVAATQVLAPGLYERDSGGQWTSGAAVSFPFAEVTSAGPQIAPLSVGYVQQLAALQDFGWMPTVGDPVVWLGTLDSRQLADVGVSSPRPLAFLADGRVAQVDVAAFDYESRSHTVGGVSSVGERSMPVSGRVLVRSMGETCCAALDARGVLTVAGSPDDAARQAIELGARDVWLDLGPKLRRLRRRRGLHA